jgi:hypothetical protein
MSSLKGHLGRTVTARVGGALCVGGLAVAVVFWSCNSTGTGGTDRGPDSADASVGTPDDDGGVGGDGGGSQDGGSTKDGGAAGDGMSADASQPDLTPLPPDLTCIPAAPPDVPDPLFLDSNCDGIDGDAKAAVFVSPSGDDTNTGSAASPVKTITKALALAGLLGKTSVYANKGTYPESVSLVGGVSIYGGFDQSLGWQRAAGNVSRIQAIGTAVSAVGLVTETHVEFMTVEALTGTAGRSSYGVFLSNSPGPVFLRYDQITAGNGADGQRGQCGCCGLSRWQWRQWNGGPRGPGRTDCWRCWGRFGLHAGRWHGR